MHLSIILSYKQTFKQNNIIDNNLKYALKHFPPWGKNV